MIQNECKSDRLLKACQKDECYSRYSPSLTLSRGARVSCRPRGASKMSTMLEPKLKCPISCPCSTSSCTSSTSSLLLVALCNTGKYKCSFHP